MPQFSLAQALATAKGLHHATRSKAQKLDEIFSAEYPALRLEAIVADATETEVPEGKITAWVVVHESTDDVTEVVSEPKVPELADVLEACQEQDLDPEVGVEDEEEVPSGSVVPAQYRAKYREASSNGQGNGDWLHEWLVGETASPETGKLNVDDLTAIFEQNGLDMSAKWALLRHGGQKGWAGRYRMNGRQLLEKVIAIREEITDAHGGQVVPPESFVMAMASKHAKWLTKERKREAAAEESIRESVEAGA